MEISIIVPVYNSAASLDLCIQSILDQTFQDFELILINDGSNDQSLSICLEYAQQNSLIVIIDQNNAGPSAARNRGINKSRGKYVVFIDSDDHIDSQFLESFFIVDQNPKEVLVQQGYVRDYGKGNKETVSFPSRTYRKTDFSDLFLSNELIKNMPFPWAKLFDANIIKKYNIRFEEDIKCGEDLIFLLDYLRHVESCILIDTCHYNYEYTEGALTYTLNSYQSELRRLTLVKAKLDILNEKFDLSQEAIAYNNAYMVKYLLRGFRAIYIDEDIIKRNQRIRIIKNYVNSDTYFYVKNNYAPTQPLNQLFKFLFVKRLCGTLDMFLFLRYKIVRDIKKSLLSG